jgi:xanthine dehydrogenase accessory factor
MTTIYSTVRDAIRAGRAVATITLLVGPGAAGAKLLLWPDGSSEGSLGDAALDARVRTDATPLLAEGASRLLAYDDLGAQLFVESFVPPPTLFMVGGVHIAIALAAMARVLGFRTVVVDARSAFASEERFAHVDELVLAWPDEALENRLDGRSCVAVLTHDPKLDDPALRVALRSSARYIGALGSPSTHARRLERLRAEGFDEPSLNRIHGPIGLPIGAKTPEEIALSILAQIVRVQRG